MRWVEVATHRGAIARLLAKHVLAPKSLPSTHSRRPSASGQVLGSSPNRAERDRKTHASATKQHCVVVQELYGGLSHGRKCSVRSARLQCRHGRMPDEACAGKCNWRRSSRACWAACNTPRFVLPGARPLPARLAQRRRLWRRAQKRVQPLAVSCSWRSRAVGGHENRWTFKALRINFWHVRALQLAIALSAASRIAGNRVAEDKA